MARCSGASRVRSAWAPNAPAATASIPDTAPHPKKRRSMFMSPVRQTAGVQLLMAGSSIGPAGKRGNHEEEHDIAYRDHGHARGHRPQDARDIRTHEQQHHDNHPAKPDRMPVGASRDVDGEPGTEHHGFSDKSRHRIVPKTETELDRAATAEWKIRNV